MDTAYYENKVKILALATAFMEGDATTRATLSRRVDFYPLATDPGHENRFHSIILRTEGNLYLVENTPGGEKGVFALLLPLM